MRLNAPDPLCGYPIQRFFDSFSAFSTAQTPYLLQKYTIQNSFSFHSDKILTLLTPYPPFSRMS